MTCEICELELLEVDRKFQAPCCERVFHSQCVMDKMTRFIDRLYDIDQPTLSCHCGYIHWTRVHQTFDAAHEVDLAVRVNENREMRLGVKAIRLKFRRINSTDVAFRRVVKTEHEHFKNGAQIHINALKTLQEESRNRLRLTPEFVAARKALASANSSLSLFKRRYNLGWAETRILFPRHRRRRRWRGTSPAQVIKWNFKLRI